MSDINESLDGVLQDNVSLEQGMRLTRQLNELKRFREREPYVRALVGAIEDTLGDQCPEWRSLVTFETDQAHEEGGAS